PVWFFFFQAEDGIRSFHVTGVQTCALPISRRRPGGHSRRRAAHAAFGNRRTAATQLLVRSDRRDARAELRARLSRAQRAIPRSRSEERRVGEGWKLPGAAGPGRRADHARSP